MKNAKLFKRSLLLLAVVALAAVLTIGIVAGAATLSEGNAEYGEEYAGVNVSVKGQVALRFYFSTLGTAEEFVAEITGPDGTDTKTIPLSDVALVTVGEGEQAQQLHRVSVSLAPSQMTYSVKLYANGTSGAGKAYVYSVKEYAEDVIADPDLSGDHDAMRALLNWGAMAQIKFNDSIDNLANAGVFAKNTNPANAVKDIADQTIAAVTSTDEAIFPTANKEVSLNVYLSETDVAMGFIFPYNGDGTLTADIYKNGALVKENDAVVSEKTGYWRVNVRDITATCYDDVYKVVVKDGTNTMTAEYSILAYIDYVIADGAKASDGSLIADDQKNVCRAMYQFYQNVEVGVINTECAHGENTYWIDNGNNTHSYKCADCFKQISSVKVPASATAYYTAFDIDQPQTSTNPYHPKSIYLVTTTGDYSGDPEYTRIEGTKETPAASQLLWQRSFVDVGRKVGTGPQQNYSIDVGSARYLVVKARTNTAGLAAKIAFSTTGKNGATAIADESIVSDGGKNIYGESIQVGDEYVTSDGYKTILLPTAAVKADEWATYVIDLAAVVPEYYVKDGDSYKVDTFYFHFDKIGVGQTLDVAYMAFVEDGGLSSIVDTAETIEVKGTSGQYKAVDSETGACLHKGVTSSVKIVDGEYHCVCNECGGTIIDYNVPETVDKFSPAVLLTNSGFVSGVTPTQTYMEEGGVNFTRFTGLTPNTQGWFAIDPSVGYGNEETGRYLVMRYRSNAQGVTSNAMQLLASNISNNCIYEAITTVRDLSDNAWHTVVIDLSTRVNDPAVAFKPEDGTTDTYVLRYLQIRPFSNSQKSVPANAYFDIEYIAVCNDINDVGDIVKEDTYEWSINGSVSVVKDKNTHVCVSHGYVESRVDNADGTVTFVSACPCGETRYNRTFPASAVVVYDPGSMITQGTSATDGRLTVSTYHQMPNKSVEMESFPFFRFYGAADGVTQMLWQRTAANSGGGTQLYKTDVGNSRFMILKLRTNDSTVSWNLRYGTVGAGNSGASFYLPFDSVKSGEWATYVIDLEEVMAAYHKQTDGAYLVDNFYFTSSGLAVDEYIDIAYLAFVEGDWSNIDEIVEDETVIRIADRSKGYAVVDPATGICTGAAHNYVATSTTEDDGSTTNTYACSVCGKVVAQQNIPANINYFADLSAMGYYTAPGTGLDKGQIDFENGVVYNHYYATESTHWAFSGPSGPTGSPGTYTSSTYNSGSYVIIKVRAAGETKTGFTLYMSTDKTTNVAAGNVGTFYVEPEDGWTVIILKNPANSNGKYALNTDAQLYFMGMPQGTDRKLDLAYLAVTDTLEEAMGLLKDNETYMLYEGTYGTFKGGFNQNGSCITHAVSAETVSGTVHSVVCSTCGQTLRSYDVKDINWYSPLSSMSSMNAADVTKNNYDDVNHLFYNRFTSTAGCHFLFTGGSGAGTWTTGSYDTGNFVVVKYRAEATSTIGLNVATEDYGENPAYPGSGRPLYSSVGQLQLRDMAGIGADGWRVAVVAIPDGKNYTKGSNQRLFFQMTSGSGNTTLDIAYCAVIDTLDEVAGLLGEGEHYYYHGTSLTNVPSECDSDGNCLHTGLTRKTVGNNYQVVCNGCGSVVYDYSIDQSAAAIFKDEYALGHYTNICCCQTPTMHNVATNSCVSVDGNLESGSPQFNRLTINPSVSNPETHVLQGQNLLGGSAVENVNYAVIKFRVGANGLGQNTMYFSFKNDNAETPSINIKVSEDNEWHTIVIDLKSLFKDYTGTYTQGFFRPFGTLTAAEILEKNPDAYVDFAYAAGCNTLEDVAKLVGGDTFEWVIDSTTTEVRHIKDILCPDGCTSAVTYSETNGVRNYSVVCSKCGSTLMTDLNWYASGADMGSYYNTKIEGTGATTMEENGVTYKHHVLDWDGTNGTGNVIFITPSNTATTYSVDTGRYLVLKMRGTASMAVTTGAATGDTARATCGESYGFNLGDSWNIVVLDLSSSANYTVDTVAKVNLTLSAYNKAEFDIAYAAVVDSTDEVKTLIGAMGEGVDTFKLMNTWNFATAEDVAVDAE